MDAQEEQLRLNEEYSKILARASGQIKKKSSTSTYIMMITLVVLIAAGAAYYYMKKRKAKGKEGEKASTQNSKSEGSKTPIEPKKNSSPKTSDKKSDAPASILTIQNE